MKPYLDKGVFKKLKNINFFNTVEIKFVTISCGENIDMCADSLYDTSFLDVYRIKLPKCLVA